MEWENISWIQINMINEVIKNIYPYLNYPFIEKVNSSDEFTAEEKDLITFLYFKKKSIDNLLNLTIELENLQKEEKHLFEKQNEINIEIEKEKEKCKKFLNLFTEKFSNKEVFYLNTEKSSTLEEIVKKCQSLELDFIDYQPGSLFNIIKTSDKMQKFLNILMEYEEKYNFLITKENEIREKIKTLFKNDLKFLKNFTDIFYRNDASQNLLEKIKQLQTS